MNALHTAWNHIKTHWVISAIAVIILILVVLHLSKGAPQSTPTEESARAVTLASVADLSSNVSPLPLLGTVTSRNEADIKAETGGRLSLVRKKLGDHVDAGEEIAEFENSAEQAALLQAEGAYDAAKAAQDIAAINTGSSGTSLDEAKTSALNTVKSTYTSLDDAVRTKTDTMFSNPQLRNAQFLVNISDAKLAIDLTNEHIDIESMLSARADRNAALTTNDDLAVELSKVESEANAVKKYLDDLSLALSKAIPDQNVSSAAISADQTATGLARTEVAGTLSSISGARTSLAASISANAVAEKNYSSGSNAAATDANLKSAQGAYDAAKSRYENTIVRSPISGTINSLSVMTGDYVAPYSDIAVVSNNGALEIVAYVTDTDAKEIAVGGNVSIDANIPGVITRIAPALDPKTKKIEVRIGIEGGNHGLINGQSVSVNASRAHALSASKVMRIPLSALKITPQGSFVFTLGASSTLVAHQVTEGALRGDQIEITEGLTPDMRIVTDARGLKEGDTVSIKQ